jgi:hypothetical protein
MSRAPIGRYPNVRLSHHLGSDRSMGTVTHHYTLTPIGIARPAEGEAAGDVACAECGGVVTYRVLNERSARTWRRVWLALMLVSFAIMGLSIAYVAVNADQPTEGNEGLINLVIVGLLGGFVVGLILLNFWWFEDGVRGPGRFFRRPHGLKLPK